MLLMRLYRAFKRYVYLQLKYFCMDLMLRRQEDAAFESGATEEIGFVDQDGLIHCEAEHRSLFHPVNVYRTGDYLHRHKFSIRIVRIRDKLLIEKQYKGRRFSFYNELLVLEKLKGLNCIPAVHSISYKEKIIRLEYIHGAILREQLAALGATIRDVDLAGRPHSYRQKARIARPFLEKAVTPAIVDQIRKCYDQIHDRKIHVHDIKYGNIIINGEQPRLIDFETSIYFPELPGFLFLWLVRTDKNKIDMLFGVQT